jgi:aspartyl-tRNA(Asn)/glutamyl-tRNA(Gln) amidotransferase subunit C
MQKITKQELLTLAHLSRLQLDERDIDSLITQIDDVLTYALRVKDVAQMSNVDELSSQKNCNVFREDVVIKTNPTDILAQAPESEQNYFVVPVILDTP